MYRSSEVHPQPGLRRVVDAVQITAAEMKAPDLVSSAADRIADNVVYLADVRGRIVNAGAKMHRLAGAKIHQRFGKKAPELGAFSSGIKPAWDYPPRYRSWQGVSVACFD